MPIPFMGEIRLVSWNIAPEGWAFCDGQLLLIDQNPGLFSLITTTYGGDGQTTFALPNLQGLTPVHMGTGFTIGKSGGEQTHTLTLGEAAAHTHSATGSSTTGDAPIAAGNYLGAAAGFYAPPPGSLTQLQPATMTAAGGGQPHDNMQPYLVLSFVIALTGLFPAVD